MPTLRATLMIVIPVFAVLLTLRAIIDGCGILPAFSKFGMATLLNVLPTSEVEALCYQLHFGTFFFFSIFCCLAISLTSVLVYSASGVFGGNPDFISPDRTAF